MIQGIIALEEDLSEVVKLVERVEKQYGVGTVVKEVFTTSVDIKLTCEDKDLWEHQVFTGSNGLPFQVTIPGNASASLEITMKFIPSGGKNVAKARVISESHTKTFVSSGTESAGTEVKLSSISESKTDQNLGKEFIIKQWRKVACMVDGTMPDLPLFTRFWMVLTID